MCSELGSKDPRDLSLDTSGTKNFAAFLVEMAQCVPNAVLPVVTSLLPHMQGEVGFVVVLCCYYVVFSLCCAAVAVYFCVVSLGCLCCQFCCGFVSLCCDVVLLGCFPVIVLCCL